MQIHALGIPVVRDSTPLARVRRILRVPVAEMGAGGRMKVCILLSFKH